MAYGTCKICGCTDKRACVHPDFGACWWIDDTHELCSHCVELPDDPLVKLTNDLKLDITKPLCASDHEPGNKLSLLLKD